MGMLDSIRTWFGTDKREVKNNSALESLLLNSLNQIKSRTGVVVTPDAAMSVPAVNAAVSIISESMAMLPLNVFKKQDRERLSMPDHPVYRLFHVQPNSYMDPFQFIEMLTMHLMLWGNCYSFKNIVRGVVTELLPIHPGRVQVKQNEAYRVTYEVSLPNGEVIEFERDAIFHVKDRTFNGYEGVSRILQLRESIGLAIETERHSAKLFGNNASPSGVLSTDQPLSREQMDNLRESWKAAHGGENQFSTAVLDGGFKFQPITMTSHDVQLIESRKFQISEVSRIYRVPPHLLGDLERATFSNIEQQSLDFVQRTLSPWIRRWEAAINNQLIGPRERFHIFSKFNVDAQLRGDIASRYSAYHVGLTDGFLSVNEVRELEDRNPIEGGDEYRQAESVFGGNEDGESDEPEPEENEAQIRRVLETVNRFRAVGTDTVPNTE